MGTDEMKPTSQSHSYLLPMLCRTTRTAVTTNGTGVLQLEKL
jgi:hypothetical protein